MAVCRCRMAVHRYFRLRLIGITGDAQGMRAEEARDIGCRSRRAKRSGIQTRSDELQAECNEHQDQPRNTWASRLPFRSWPRACSQTHFGSPMRPVESPVGGNLLLRSLAIYLPCLDDGVARAVIAKAKDGTTNHCNNGASPVPSHGRTGINELYDQLCRTSTFSHSLKIV